MYLHDTPKPVATGKIAQEIREAVRRSFGKTVENTANDSRPRRHTFIWEK